jgi:LEA14-like dessication related protein
MESLYYKVSLDSVEVAEGSSMEPFMVVGGGEADLPLKINTDMKTLLQSDKRATVTKVIRNLVGVSNEPTDVTVQLKPSIRVGNGLLTSPVYFPIKFVYSGKKGSTQTATY